MTLGAQSRLRVHVRHRGVEPGNVKAIEQERQDGQDVRGRLELALSSSCISCASCLHALLSVARLGNVKTVGRGPTPRPTEVGAPEDPLRHEVVLIDAMGHVTSYAYDAVGHQAEVTDANGHVRSTQYDPVDRVAVPRRPCLAPSG